MTTNDLLNILALIGLVSGLAGVTYRAFMLLVQLTPPKKFWIARGVMLCLLGAAYLLLVGLQVPGALAALQETGQHATFKSAVRTGSLALWLWVLNTILLMLARGRLGPQPTLPRVLTVLRRRP